MRRDAGHRGKGDLHHVEVVEAANADLLRHRDGRAVAFEQHAECQVVIVAEDAIKRRHLCQRVAEQVPPERDGGRHRRRVDQPRIVEAGGLHGGPVAGEPPLRAGVHARAEKSDAVVAGLDHVGRRRPPAVEMREADHHVDRIGAGFHDLDDWTIGLLEQVARGPGLVDAGNDQRRRPLAEEHLQQPLLLEPGIMRVA